MTEGVNGGPLTREFIALEAQHTAGIIAAHMLRLDEIRTADHKRIDDLREADRELRASERRGDAASSLAESRRIDALLGAAENRVLLATTEAKLTAAALAERVEASRTVLVGLVETTAKATATSAEATTRALSDRIKPLEEELYRGGGVRANQRESKDDRQWGTQILFLMPGVALAVAALVLLIRG